MSDGPASNMSAVGNSEKTATGEEVSGGDLSMGSWIAGARILSQVSQFLIVIMAVRFIAPSEFGTFALLSAVGVGLARVAEAGWREFIMNTKDVTQLAEVHCLAMLAGSSVLMIGALLGFAMAWLGVGKGLTIIMLLLSAWTLLATLSAIQAGILVRRGAFAALALSQMSGEIVGVVAAGIVFFSGGGVVGLAIAKLLTQAILFAGSLIASRWFSLRIPRNGRWREPFHFSSNILATRLIGYAHDNVALFAIGLLTGPTNAGLFRASGRLAGAMGDVINEPVRLLAWSVLQRSGASVILDQLLFLTFLIATPLYVGLALTSGDVINLFFGKDWAAATPLLVAFAVAGIFSLLNAVTEPLLSCRGHVSLVPRLSVIFTASAILILVVTAPFGIFWIATGQMVLSAILLPVTIWIQQHYGGTSPLRVLLKAYPAAAGSFVLACAVLAVDHAFAAELSAIFLLAAKIVAGAMGYAITILLLVPIKALGFKTSSL
jgi:O-antigen/teichoic acid export membrane protein